MSKPVGYNVILILLSLILIVYPVSANAQTTHGNGNSTVSGRIGAFYLNLSGFIAPNASITVITDNTVLQSTVSNQNGYFYITSVHIQRGFSHFCLDAIDFKRLGESYTCFAVLPANRDITLNDIFLPPTLGLQRTEITVGQDAIAWGYSMPHATVTIHASDGKTYVVTTDPGGYYQINFKIATAGTYELYADANYQNQQSKIPDKKITLTALSVTQNSIKQTKNAAKKAAKIITQSPWGWILLVVGLLTVIFLLLKKLKPEWFTFIEFSGVNFHIGKIYQQKKLHHAWFVGY